MARNHSKPRKAHAGADNPRRGPARPPRRAGAGRDGSGADGGPLWIWGTHAVLAALANPARKCHELLATENAAQRLPATGPIAPVLVTARDIDARLPDGAVHQGIAVKVDPLEAGALEDLIDAGISHIAVLDQVSDPHNLGAVYRSAAAFGFGGLVLQTRNAPNVTGVAAKAAVGAIETVREARVVNIARALEQLGDAGYHTVGLAGEGERLIADAVEGAQKLAIVLGAEGPGIRPAVAKACAELARIPIAPEMESLNVSNAAAVAFYESSRKRFPLS
jgi:23S rRNA (guanosine2251-2'-O)-methyltransferase